jgi:Mn-dependent DtxR family transcriptional regulator
MTSLQKVHRMVQYLSSGDSGTISIEAIANELNCNKEDIIPRLRQLADLGYLTFLRGNNLVALTENGILTQPYRASSGVIVP